MAWLMNKFDINKDGYSYTTSISYKVLISKILLSEETEYLKVINTDIWI